MQQKRGPKTPMSDQHKAALAKGRMEGRIVREYLDGLRATKPKRGRKRTTETIQTRLDAVELEVVDASPIDELLLIQERRDLQAELARKSDTVDMDALAESFVAVAKSYGDSKSISYASWRDVGVPASTLKSAGISRGD
jgi:hypothetical protein